MVGSLHIEVLLFARLRELAGTRTLELDVGAGATTRTAWEAAVERVPRLAGSDASIRVAVNEVYADWDTALSDHDVIAFLPPVAGGVGGAARVHVMLTREPLDPRACEELVRSDADGGICTFTGVVRDHAEGRAVEAIEYEAYPEMAEREMRRLGEEALAASGASAVALHHRLGRLEVGDASVVISAAAHHRAEAFDCCRRAIDGLKERVPVWKRELGEGGAVWVDEIARAASRRQD